MNQQAPCTGIRFPAQQPTQLFYLPEVSAVLSEAVVQRSPLPVFAVMLVLAEGGWVIIDLKNVVTKISFQSVLKARIDLQRFSHLCRKNDAFLEATHWRDSSLPEEFSYPPRSVLSAAGYLHILQTTSRYILPAGLGPRGAAKAACTHQQQTGTAL